MGVSRWDILTPTEGRGEIRMRFPWTKKAVKLVRSFLTPAYSCGNIQDIYRRSGASPAECSGKSQMSPVARPFLPDRDTCDRAGAGAGGLGHGLHRHHPGLPAGL